MTRAPADARRDLREVQVAVFAKAPIPGLAKTRLAPALGAAGAARLQRRLTLAALDCAWQAQLGPVTLWCTPRTDHRFFRALQRRAGLRCLEQEGADLGARMHAAFSLHCRRGPLLLIGTDCPVLRPEHLRQAGRALLAGDDAVFHPAEDGGYVLVGLRQPQPALFDGVDWSTARVMGQTRERALAAGLRWCELQTLWDVDRPQDLHRLRSLAAHAGPRVIVRG